MKSFRLPFVTALITFGIGLSVSWMFSEKTVTSRISKTRTTIVRLDSPCTHDKVAVKHQPEATARLRILEATCGTFGVKAKVALENLGPAPIRGYEVGIIQHYEQKRDVESSERLVSSDDVLVAPGEMRILTLNGGFSGGYSCDKRTGSLQTTIFWIKRLDYIGGHSWREAFTE